MKVKDVLTIALGAAIGFFTVALIERYLWPQNARRLYP